MNDYAKEFLITLFGGLFGVHKFLKGDKVMGFLYLFTFGLFGIGWIVDLIKLGLANPNGFTGSIFNFDTNNKYMPYAHKSLMGVDGLKAINEGKIPNIQGSNLILSDGETCCYMDSAYTFVDKTITTGYSGKRNGVSFRIAKGISYHTGGSGSKAIRETKRIIYNGILYLTTNRIIYTAEKNSFDKPFDKITSVSEFDEGIMIQIGSNVYSIITKTHTEFMKVYTLIRQLKK